MQESSPALTTVAGVTAIGTSAANSISPSESLLSASLEQIYAGAYTVQLSDITGLIAVAFLMLNTAINVFRYFRQEK